MHSDGNNFLYFSKYKRIAVTAVNCRTFRKLKKKVYSLKSDFSISKELSIKEPAEENIQTGKHRQKPFLSIEYDRFVLNDW